MTNVENQLNSILMQSDTQNKLNIQRKRKKKLSKLVQLSFK